MDDVLCVDAPRPQSGLGRARRNVDGFCSVEGAQVGGGPARDEIRSIGRLRSSVYSRLECVECRHLARQSSDGMPKRNEQMLAFACLRDELVAPQRGEFASFAAISARRSCATKGHRLVSPSVLLLSYVAYEVRGEQKMLMARRRVVDAFRTPACQLTRRGIVRTLAIEQS